MDRDNAARMPGASAVAGPGESRSDNRGSDDRVKSEEAALRRVANTGAVGAFAIAQAAPGGRRAGPRIRRTASARRRARERAGLDTGPADPEEGANGGGEQEVNPDELIAADVELEQMIMEEEEEENMLGFWQFDRTDKIICGGICFLVVTLIVILAVAMT